MMKKGNKKSRTINTIMLVAFVLMMIFAIYGFSGMVKNIDGEMVAKTPDAILASAGVEDKTGVLLPVAYFDQRADECVNLYDIDKRDALYARQFEWTNCGYEMREMEKGLVEYYLGDDYLPVGVGGELTPNRGVGDMARWFTGVDGKSKSYPGTIELQYSSNNAEFWFTSKEFYPLDRADFSVKDFSNDDGHNHLFTMSFAVPFTALLSGNESFSITADDDTFVFLDDKLIIDMGGIHEATTGKMMINENGEVYTSVMGEDFAYSGVNLDSGFGTMVRIVHADRDARDSVFEIDFKEMSLSVMNTEIANGGGIQIAYDPSDPTFVAPLGVSKIFNPDNTKGYFVMATIYGVLVVVSSVFVVILAKYMIKRKAE